MMLFKNRHDKRKRYRRASLTIVAALVFTLTEVACRLLGLGDFPLYIQDDNFGYLPAPNQSGSFLNTYYYSFNEFSFGLDENFSANNSDTLLIGDSIVFGGRRVDQTKRLGALLQEMLPTKIWPISATSWSLINELAWMKVNPDLVKRFSSTLIISNSGDFAGYSQWSNNYYHPKHYPISVIFYFGYYWLIGRLFDEPVALKSVNWAEIWKGDVKKMSDEGCPFIVALYPDRAEMLDSELRYRHLLRFSVDLLNAGATSVIDIGSDPRWKGSQLYLDEIHPSLEGRKLLAAILAEQVGGQLANSAGCRREPNLGGRGQTGG